MESDNLAQFLTRLILPTVLLRLCDWRLLNVKIVQHVNSINERDISCYLKLLIVLLMLN